MNADSPTDKVSALSQLVNAKVDEICLKREVKIFKKDRIYE